LADQDVIARGVRAERFLEEARFYFDKLREAYKESIARAFESGNPDAKPMIGSYGAQLAALADLEQQLETLAAGGEIAKRSNEEEQ